MHRSGVNDICSNSSLFPMASVAEKLLLRCSFTGIGRFFLLIMIVLAATPARALDSFEAPDAAGDPGFFHSMVLDSNGYPVVAYVADGLSGNDELRVLRCGDVNCAGPNSIEVVTSGQTFVTPSVQLDANDYPVIAYSNVTKELTIVHCNDIYCDGGDESIEIAGEAHLFGISLVLDSAGYPVVSYLAKEGYVNRLALLHCDDPNCSPDIDGTADSSVYVDPGAMSGGSYSSLQLDADGFPVIAYPGISQTGGNLIIAHCNDPDCAGGDESIEAPYQIDGGGKPSLVLDASGYPVVSYKDYYLYVLHCNDVNCADHDESIARADFTNVGAESSIQLDADGYPVISHIDSSFGNLAVTHCNEVNCEGDDESRKRPDQYGDQSGSTSLALDANGFPVVSYHNATLQELRIMHCGDAVCSTLWREVLMDIEPDDPANVVNAFDPEGLFEVAILGAADFDAAEIDPAVLRLSGYPGYVRLSASPVDDEGVIEDVNDDGYPDFTIRFPFENVGISCQAVNQRLDLQGNQYSGLRIISWDVVTRVGPCSMDIDIDPYSYTNYVHPHHNYGSLNDVISVALYSGFPNLDAPTVKLGPAQASPTPDSPYIIPAEIDPYTGYELEPEKTAYDFLTGDTGLTCTDTEVTLLGSDVSGQEYVGTDSITPDCDSQCH